MFYVHASQRSHIFYSITLIFSVYGCVRSWYTITMHNNGVRCVVVAVVAALFFPICSFACSILYRLFLDGFLLSALCIAIDCSFPFTSIHQFFLSIDSLHTKSTCFFFGVTAIFSCYIWICSFPPSTILPLCRLHSISSFFFLVFFSFRFFWPRCIGTVEYCHYIVCVLQLIENNCVSKKGKTSATKTVDSN